HRVASVADPDKGVTDANRALAVEYDTLQSGPVAVEEHAVGAAGVFGDQPALIVAYDPHMVTRHVRIVDHHVVVVGTANAHLRSAQAEAGGHVAMARQDLDPDYRVPPMASMNRRPSAMASA